MDKLETYLRTLYRRNASNYSLVWGYIAGASGLGTALFGIRRPEYAWLSVAVLLLQLLGLVMFFHQNTLHNDHRSRENHDV